MRYRADTYLKDGSVACIPVAFLEVSREVSEFRHHGVEHWAVRDLNRVTHVMIQCLLKTMSWILAIINVRLNLIR
jgi:hypothetical protein